MFVLIQTLPQVQKMGVSDFNSYNLGTYCAFASVYSKMAFFQEGEVQSKSAATYKAS